MKNTALLLPLIALAISCQNQDNYHIEEDFNLGWKFSLNADSTAALPDFNDSGWRTLNLPHDWSIEGEFSNDNPSTAGGGALPGGYGVYRKEFYLAPEDSVRQIFVQFDGVYWNSTVYVNGQKAGFRPNGYVSFEYDITPLVKFGAQNLIAVTVDNTDQPNSRWYSGSGIYRNVYLKKLSPCHINEAETFVYSTQDNGTTLLSYQTVVDNADSNIEIEATIYAPSGQSVYSNRSKGSKVQIDKVQINNPQLWSVDNPVLYRAEFKALHNGKITDIVNVTFGIRYFDFDPDNGFSLNGKPMKINGVCNHHDLGALGTAVNHRALQRQLEILKNMGCNAIRTSHNPPARELLNLCDSMGFLVMDEAFDMWARKKSPNDYAKYFAEWHERDLADFIKRDRNHPSVVIWSVGNEILEQWRDISTDTLSIEKANLMFNFAAQLSKNDDTSTTMHVNSMLCKKLVELVKSIDPTRPVTTGNNETEPTNLLFRSGALDVIGFNYHEYNWGEAFKQKFPGMPLIITESTSALQTRGHYIAPADTQYLWPVRWDIPFETDHHKCSAYDNVRAPWGSTHETTLREYMKYPWVSGIFVWTGFDYIGEPTPYGWPSRSSYFGIIDLAGFPKDVYYLYKSLWTNEPVLHLLPHWNWNNDDSIDVVAYTNLNSVELFLNGKSLGKKSLDGNLHLLWRVGFEAGELKAIGYTTDGKEITDIVRTADKSSRLVAKADRCEIDADGYDLSFVTVDITDDNGVIVPDACNKLTFEVKGPAEIVGLDNGDQVCHESFKGTAHSAFNGKCLCIIRSLRGQKGIATLTVQSDGLASAEAEIKVK